MKGVSINAVVAQAGNQHAPFSVMSKSGSRSYWYVLQAMQTKRLHSSIAQLINHSKKDSEVYTDRTGEGIEGWAGASKIAS